MSASEWNRIIDERDEAVMHLVNVIDILERFGMEDFKEYKEAKQFISEYQDDE